MSHVSSLDHLFVIRSLQLLPLPSPFTTSSSDDVTQNDVQNVATNCDAVEENADDDDFGESTELRGTIFWAPPRPQLILKIHRKPR